MKKTALLLTPAVVLALAFLFLRSQAQAGAARPTAPRAIEASNSLRSVSAEGRVVTYPGYEVEIGSDFAGTVSRVLVDEKSEVRKGEPT
jgi:multidrug efflux pump subunit AcrA (membrane-fusion protein)